MLCGTTIAPVLLPVRRISVGGGSTVSFSRILLNMLHMKIAKDLDAKDVDEVRQGTAMLQHWHLPVYVRRLRWQ